MELKRIPYRLTVCKVADISAVDMDSDFYFLGKTDEEIGGSNRIELLKRKACGKSAGPF